jgi:hypothetical protein
LSAATALRTCLSSCSSSTTHSCVAVAFLSRSSLPFARSASDYSNTTGHRMQLNSTSLEISPRKRLTVNTSLIVKMALRTACISSLSSKISSYQGVPFQSISQRLNVGPVDDEPVTCVLDVSRFIGACSIRIGSPTRS